MKSCSYFGAVLAALTMSACLEPAEITSAEETVEPSHVLAVASHHEIALYDVETGEKRPGGIHAMGQTTDMQALHSGLFMVNLTERNEILAFDAEGNEAARIPSSAMAVTRPVHSFVYAENGHEKYFIASSDHDNKGESSFVLIDLDPASPAYLTRVAEYKLGRGHHKAAVSGNRPRIVISNMFDPANVLSVIDFGDPAAIKTLATYAVVEGSPLPRPHGCGYAAAAGRAYCNFTGSGVIASVDIDADSPSFVTMATGGAGAGYTKPHAGGRYVFSVQSKPREGDMKLPGAACQIGQLVLIDSQENRIAAEVPMLYEGPGCTRELAGTPQSGAGPFRMEHTYDGKRLFVSLSSGMNPDGFVDREVVFDTSDPARPVQLASVKTGRGSGHHGQTLTGDDKYLFVADNLDNTVTQIDVATLTVVRTLPVGEMPHWVATYGNLVGPSHQVGPVH